MRKHRYTGNSNHTGSLVRLGLVQLTLLGAVLGAPSVPATTIGMVPDGEAKVVMILDADHDLSVGTVQIDTAGLQGACAINADQTLGFVTDDDRNVWIIDLGLPQPKLATGTNPIRISDRGVDMAVSPNHDRLLVCGAGSTVSVVDLASREEVGVFDLGSACDAIDVCADGTVLVASSDRGVVRTLTLEDDGSLADSTERLIRSLGPDLGPQDVVCNSNANFGMVVYGSSPEVLTFSLPTMEAIASSPLTGRGIGSSIVAPEDGDGAFAGAVPDSGSEGPITIDVFSLDPNSGSLSPSPALTIPTEVSGAARRARNVIALHPDGSRLYVPLGDLVGVFDSYTGESVEVVTDPVLIRAGGVCFAATGPRPAEDFDADGWPDVADNCPDISNSEQGDQDGDGIGDLCDVCPSLADPSQIDDDGDLIGNMCDDCPVDANPGQADSNRDGVGDACAPPPPGPTEDSDGDGVPDVSDNCLDEPNSDQADTDGDSSGDVCDTCPTLFNPDQGGQVLLSGEGSSVYSEFIYSPDASSVVYRAAEGSPWDRELFAAPASGGTPIKLNGPLVNDGDVSDKFQVSPDSSRVVYLADERINYIEELFSVPITGGPSVRLNGTLPSGGGISEHFGITPDGTRVVYLAQQDDSHKRDLYSVPIDGGQMVNLTAGLDGNASAFEISPDGQRIVFRYRSGNDQLLYSVPVMGGTPVLVNTPRGVGGRVSSGFKISSDSTRVFYLAVQDTLVFDLYVAPISGGPSTRLSSAAPRGVYDFLVSPDESAVVYRARNEDSVLEIFGVPAAGGAVVKLNEPFRSYYINPYLIAADSRTVVYIAMEDTPGVRELYSVPIFGGLRTKLNAPLVSNGEVTNFSMTVDGDFVVYNADQEVDGVFSLYRVTLTGGQPKKIIRDQALTESGTHRISPDGSKILYKSSENELFITSSSGGNSRLLTPGTTISNPFLVSPDFTSVAYRVPAGLVGVSLALDGDADGTFDECDTCVDRDGDGFGDPAFSAISECPIDNCPDISNADQADGDGDQAGDACDNCPSDGNPDQGDADFDGTGDTCDPCPGDALNDEDSDGFCGDVDNCPFVYNADQLDSDGDSLGEVCDICPYDHDPEQLDSDGDEVGDGCDVCPQIFNPDQLDRDSDRVGDECDNCPDAPNPDQANSDQDQAGDACDLCPGDANDDSDGDGICGDVDNCPLDPNPAQSNIDNDPYGDSCDNCPTIFNSQQGVANLNGPLTSQGDVLHNYVVTGDSSSVVYMARGQISSDTELFSVPVAGGTITRLNHPLLFHRNVYSFHVSGDGSTVIYTATILGTSGLDMFSVPTGGGAPVILSENQANQPFFQQVELVDDGSTVVYVADQNSPGVYELFSMPSSGGTPIKLNLERAGSFVITPDGTHVVYHELLGEGFGTTRNLFSVPVLGGPANRLSPPPPSGGAVQHRFEVTSNSERVVYIADQEVDNRFELFSVLLDGQNLVKLNTVTSVGVHVFDFYIVPDGSQVVYLSNQEDPATNELFAVPVDGGPRVKVSGTMGLHGDVLDAMISPDGTTVVYRADQDTNGVIELYSAPISGGPSVKLNGYLVSGGNVSETYFITSDSSRVVYLADQDTNNVTELYSVPVGGGSSLNLSPLSDPSDDIMRVALSGDGATVVYSSRKSNALMAVPVSGGNPTRINDTDVLPSARIGDIRIVPDSSLVVFRSNPNIIFTDELFSTPLALDADADGILDDCDGCPSDPEKTEPGICGCGSSDTETDPPFLICPEDLTFECGSPDTPDVTGVATGTDACSPPAFDFVDTLIAECGSSGTLVRSWTATDPLGNASTCDQILTVVDTTPPTVTAPVPWVLECNMFGGVALSNPQVQEWIGLVGHSDACGPVAASSDAPSLIPVGTTAITFLATDACGNVSSATSTLGVEDTTPPQLSVQLTPNSLWPPDHRMVHIDATVIASDVCSTTNVVLSSATSNESDNGQGDGNTVNDIQRVVTGTTDYGYELRAERAGSGSGRVYTMIYRVEDAAGNAFSEAGFVVVPHDQEGVTDPLNIIVSKSNHGTLVSWDDVPGSVSYDVIRGQLERIAETDVAINLGSVTCLEAGSPDVSTAGWEDVDEPEPGNAFFYLVEYDDGTSSSFGTESASKPRAPGAGSCN